MLKKDLELKYNEMEKDYLAAQQRIEELELIHQTYDLEMNSYRNEMQTLKEKNQELLRNQTVVQFEGFMNDPTTRFLSDIGHFDEEEASPEETITLDDIVTGWNGTETTTSYGHENSIDDLMKGWN